MILKSDKKLILLLIYVAQHVIQTHRDTSHSHAAWTTAPWDTIDSETSSEPNQ